MTRFANRLPAISTGQAGSYGQPVELALKLDLIGFDMENLVFYSYDKLHNSYTKLKNPAYWVDKNGYLHFMTTQAGYIIVSEGKLQKK